MIISKVITNSKIIAVHFSRQKELSSKSNLPDRIYWTFKNPGHENVANESMFVLRLSAEIEKTRLKFSQGSVTAL